MSRPDQNSESPTTDRGLSHACYEDLAQSEDEHLRWAAHEDDRHPADDPRCGAVPGSGDYDD